MNNPNFNIWSGHKVKLRRLQLEDADAILNDDDDTDSARYANEVMLPVSASKLKEKLGNIPDTKEHDIWLGIEELATGKLVGTLDVHGADSRHKCFEYGIHLFRDARQKGFASEAIALICRYYFQELGYHRIWATVYSYNEPSIALHRSLGFTEEGRLRQSLFTNGQFYDEVVFGMLDTEFTANLERLPRDPFPH